MLSQRGEWLPGIAGGCPKHETYGQNPQYVLAPSVPASFTIELTQPANASDAVVFAYLEDADERGGVRYVTEGVLRLAHRAARPAARPSFLSSDMRPIPRGEAARVELALEPVAYSFPPGHAAMFILTRT